MAIVYRKVRSQLCSGVAPAPTPACLGVVFNTRPFHDLPNHGAL